MERVKTDAKNNATAAGGTFHPYQFEYARSLAKCFFAMARDAIDGELTPHKKIAEQMQFYKFDCSRF
jgi:hypothetical protein